MKCRCGEGEEERLCAMRYVQSPFCLLREVFCQGRAGSRPFVHRIVREDGEEEEGEMGEDEESDQAVKDTLELCGIGTGEGEIWQMDTLHVASAMKKLSGVELVVVST